MEPALMSNIRYDLMACAHCEEFFRLGMSVLRLPCFITLHPLYSTFENRIRSESQGVKFPNPDGLNQG